MKQDFLNYIQKTFLFSNEEIKKFEKYIEKPLKKSIRINTNKISIKDFKKLALKNNWKLTASSLWKNTFYIDRDDVSTPLWSTLEHISGLFYVQEISASSSPFYMSWDKVDKLDFTILDMSASPWWKTTSLSEYYPNSLIIANELLKPRLKWLFVNLNRMSALNTVVTNYDWRFFKNLPETFDKILLDAPCSGEWTAFKNPETLKFWNIKNIKKISRLQFWLLESAFIALKTWWEIVYSTCTLNKIENEWVINKLIKKYWNNLEIIPIWKNNLWINKQLFESQSMIGWVLWNNSENISSNNDTSFKRNWQHLDFTWWFFVAKIKKTSTLTTLSQKENNINKKQNKWDKENDIKFVRQNIEKLSSKESKYIKSFIKNNFWYDEKYYLYKYKTSIFLTNKNLDYIWEKLFLYQIWVHIWELKNSEFIPNFYLWTIKIFKNNTIDIKSKDLDRLYSWKQLKTNKKDWYYQIKLWNIPAGIARIKNNKLKSLLENNLIRR